MISMSLVFTALLSVAAYQAPAETAQEAPFPPSTPIAEGLSPEGVAGLSDLIQGFADDGDIVGGELLVIKNGRTVLHKGYGWRDRDEKVAMEPGTVFCVRSMTKPLIGMSISMLLEEKKIKLRDKIAKYLPAFDKESTREITIEQLLQHTSGLPMSLIMGEDPRKLESIRAVADLAGGLALEFEPGTAFNYSDQGTDTLTALIEVVAGVPPQDFVASRILGPLGMDDSAPLLGAAQPIHERAASKYVGVPGSWNRYWSPEDEPLFPVFLGSQALYSTAVDYAKFLDLWLRRGRGAEGRLLKSSSVRRTLKPSEFPLGAPSGFPDLEASYGSLMQLWTRKDEDRDVVVFGHTGSDGTHAWAFPDQKAMVLYFTQSRGTLTGLQVEEHLGALLLGVPFDPIQAAPPLEQYLGYYCEDQPNDRYRSIILHEGGLALEILGKAVVPLVYTGEDRWKLKPQPGTVLAFDRSDSGDVTGYHIGDHQEFRFEPADDLPSADEVADLVSKTHRVDLLESLGVLKMTSEFSMEKLGVSGTRQSWYASPDRWRVDEATGEGGPAESARTASDGEALRMQLPGQEVEAQEGLAVELMDENSLSERFGDWRRRGIQATVIQRLGKDGESILLVRLGDTSRMARTLYIDENLGIVKRLDGMTFLPGMGMIGQSLQFRDFKEVDGMQLPERISVDLAHSMIGEILVTITKFEVGVEVSEGWFRLEDG